MVEQGLPLARASGGAGLRRRPPQHLAVGQRTEVEALVSVASTVGERVGADRDGQRLERRRARAGRGFARYHTGDILLEQHVADVVRRMRDEGHGCLRRYSADSASTFS